MKKCTVVELNVQIDHIHLVVRTPRSLSVFELMGFVKGRMAIRLFAKFLNLRKYKLWGSHFLSKRIFCGFSRGKRRNHPTICTVPGQGSQRGRRKTNTSGTGRVVFKPSFRESFFKDNCYAGGFLQYEVKGKVSLVMLPTY